MSRPANDAALHLSQVSKPYQVAHFLELALGITVRPGAKSWKTFNAMWDGKPGKPTGAPASSSVASPRRKKQRSEKPDLL